jgi:hypothetical protein
MKTELRTESDGRGLQSHETMPPGTLALQPKPKELLVAYVPSTKGGESTIITRTWNDGDYLRCRLCPHGMCGATASGVCQVAVIGERIPLDSCALFSSVGRHVAPMHGLSGPRIKRLAD